jgi:hypothetical protein
VGQLSLRQLEGSAQPAAPPAAPPPAAPAAPAAGGGAPATAAARAKTTCNARAQYSRFVYRLRKKKLA